MSGIVLHGASHGSVQATEKALRASEAVVWPIRPSNSRLAYVEVLDGENAVTAAAFAHRAVRWFDRQGVTVEAAMTDNGHHRHHTAFGGPPTTRTNTVSRRATTKYDASGVLLA